MTSRTFDPRPFFHGLRRLKIESQVAAIFGLLFGLSCLLVVPPLTTYDAPGHYYRAVSVERGKFRPTIYSNINVGAEISNRHVYFAEHLWHSYWSKNQFGSPAEWKRVSDEALREGGSRRVDFTNIAVYSPINYIFQSLGLGLSALLTRSPLMADRMGCVFNLAGCLALVILSIELVPCLERGVLLLATTPLLIVQYASLSADGLNFAIPLLFVALLAHLRRKEQATRGKLAALAFLALALALLKPSAIAFLFCLLGVPVRHFRSWKAGLLALGLVWAGAAGLWLYWNQPYFNVDIMRFNQPDHIHSAAAKAAFLARPFSVFPALAGYFRFEGARQLASSFGQVGGWVTPNVYRHLPIFSAVFFAALFANANYKQVPDPTWGLIMFLQGLAALMLIAVSLYVKCGEPGATIIPGFGGRYYAPILLCFLFSFSAIFPPSFARLRATAFGLGLIANGAFTFLILYSIGSRVLR
jgi:hypothetical protein